LSPVIQKNIKILNLKVIIKQIIIITITTIIIIMPLILYPLQIIMIMNLSMDMKNIKMMKQSKKRKKN